MAERMCFYCEEPIGMGRPYFEGRGINRGTYEHTECKERFRGRQEGAAIAFGLMGMFRAIKRTHWQSIEACPRCMKHSCGWVGIGRNKLCLDCWDLVHAKRALPYR